MGTPTNNIDWFDGQPSMGGTNISITANSVDLTAMPDLWVQLTDIATGYPTEVDLFYELNTPPQLTCPADIVMIGSDANNCGAFVMIPPPSATDDSITPLPDEQVIFMNYTFDGQTLQFDFNGTNIDPTRPATLTINISGDIGLSSEYYDIFDENGNFLTRLGNGGSSDCTSETSTFTITRADLVTYLADNIITFTATGTSSVNPICGLNGVEMNLVYTPASSSQYFTITNDYNSDGANASDFYLPGTTTVTYIAIDGCGNTSTCTVDITVTQEITEGPET